MKALRLALALVGSALGLALAVVVALVCALWLWSASTQSLAGTLEYVARWLPADQTLQAQGVTGTLRGGGHITWLRWQRGELSVELRQARLQWSPQALLEGRMQIDQLQAQLLRIEDHRPADPAPAQPPTDLGLPIGVDLTMAVDTVQYVGSTAAELRNLAVHYTFDSAIHTVDEGQVHISSGTYRFNGSLQASAPMALALQLDGTVQTPVPARQAPLQVHAHATVNGTLAGLDAALDINAMLDPHLTAVKSGRDRIKLHTAPSATVQARIMPWQVQPVAHAKAQWQGLNLATLWPQAPQTLLSGKASVTPNATVWESELSLDNSLSGPWDQQRIPVEHLQAKLAYADKQWRVLALTANAGGGRLQAQGQFSDSAQWHGSATAQGIHPEALDTRMGQAVLDGLLTAQQSHKGIVFNVQLTATPKSGDPRAKKSAVDATKEGIQLQSLQAKGLWAAPTLTLEQLTLQTDEARAEGQATINTETFATQGKLSVTLPGALANVDGAISLRDGQGHWALRVDDVAHTVHWLNRLPGMGAGVARLAGSGTMTGSWQGGWHDQGRALQVQAALRLAALAPLPLSKDIPPPWQVRDALIDLSGTLPAMRLSGGATLTLDDKVLEVNSQVSGGYQGDGRWQTLVQSLNLQGNDPKHPGRWTLQLSKPVALQGLQRNGAASLALAPGSARLSGPVPGTVQLQWQAANWSHTNDATDLGRTNWLTRGQIDGLPLAWLDWLGRSQMANVGLHGDMLLSGKWDASGGDALNVRASLARSSGDLQIQTDVAQAPRVQAGVRDARLVIAAQGERISASLLWDSERAGRLQADFGTRLVRKEGSWAWPDDAPVQGRAKVQMPPLSLWSILAPPGWRLRGTLDADATLSGSRAAPQWSGTLAAQDLRIRSVVDGIDFSQGSLKARLMGQRLEVDAFTVRGAGAASGGVLDLSGALWWPPGADANPGTGTLSRLRMQMQARAQQLRVSARADRKLVASGAMTATLENSILTLRGKLKADEALYQVPEETAPQLGDDVVVRTSATIQPSAPPAQGTSHSAMALDLNVTLDPGRNFVVRGRGIDTRLAGELVLRRVGEKPLRLTGTLRTAGGTYKAYGQNLNIEQGLMRFDGPYDNPALDILAIRPNLQQRVGVQIVGTVLAPVVRLYADPDLPDAEKLAWLVLGRSGASGGAETAVLQQAAMALLGGKGPGLPSQLMDALGIDEVSVRSDGATNPDGSKSATVVLGKRVSQDFYLAFERSVAGTMGTLSIFYDLSRRFAIRAQAGTQNAVDLIFTLPYD